MKQRIANYTVIIEKQKRLGTKKTCYAASVPLLGIATEGDTIEEAKDEMQSLLQFHLESLAQEGIEIPIETTDALVTKSQVAIPAGAKFSVA